MVEWLQRTGGMLAWGRPGDLWLLAIVPFATRLLLQWAAKWIERMEPTGAARLRLAWLTAAMPGIAFLALAPGMIHTLDPRAMGSVACMAHCYGLMFLVVTIVGTAVVWTWRRSRNAAQLLKIAQKPSPRLSRFAEELGIAAVELPTDTPVCAEAGAFTPRVLVSRGALARLSDEELRAALAHERAHLRRRETLRAGVAAFLNRCTFARVPAAFNLYLKSREFAADHEAAREVKPITLANVLVAFARFELASQSLVQLAETTNLRDRVSLLLNGAAPNSAATKAHAVAIALIVGAAIIAMLPASVHAVQRALCLMSR